MWGREGNPQALRNNDTIIEDIALLYRSVRLTDVSLGGEWVYIPNEDVLLIGCIA